MLKKWAETYRKSVPGRGTGKCQGPEAEDVLDIRPTRVSLHEMACAGLTNEVEDTLLSCEFILLYEATFVLAPGNEATEINRTRHVPFQTNGGG